MKTLLAVSLLAFAPPVAMGAPSRPNLVFIMADDLGWNGVGFQGNREVNTPNLDRLAAEGMRFTQAYAETQCSPTRGAFLSGRWPARTGLWAVTNERPPARAPLLPAPFRELGPEVATLASTLRAAGYATGLSGKWHIADNYNAAPLRARDEGRYFDRYGWDYVGEAGNREKDKATEGITGDLLGFIERSRNRPFFAFFSYHAPHTPMEAPRALVDKYVARGFRRSSSNLCLTEEMPTADYYAMVEHLDAAVGRVMARLEALGLDGNTMVIFTSDNGGLNRMASMAPLRGAKGAPYEGGLRVPLAVRWPARVAAGSVSHVPVHTVDFYATFAEVAGAAAPHALDGVSLLPLLTGRDGWTRDTLFWHMPNYTPMYGRTPCSVIRRGDWKLVRYDGDCLDLAGQVPRHQEPYGRLVLGARVELYDLARDPAETHDLAAEEPARVSDLGSELDALLTATGAGRVRPNPAFRADDPDWWKPATVRGAQP